MYSMDGKNEVPGVITNQRHVVADRKKFNKGG